MQDNAILSEILKKFKTQKACAEAMGISEQAFSHGLRRKTKKFLARLRAIGIVLPNKEDKRQVPNEALFFFQAEELMRYKIKADELEKENMILKEKLSKYGKK